VAGREAGARDAAGGVGGDGRARRDQVAGEERQQAEEHGRWVAPRIGDDARGAHALARELRQAVRRGRGRRVQGAVQGRVPRPQVRREVDHLGAGSARVSDPLGRGAVGEGAEDERGVAERRVVGADEGDLAPPNAGALAPPLAGRREGELQARVRRGERAELAPGVAARAEDPYRNLMHFECILFRHRAVNG
jgi:hypothetical protein